MNLCTNKRLAIFCCKSFQSVQVECLLVFGLRFAVIHFTWIVPLFAGDCDHLRPNQTLVLIESNSCFIIRCGWCREQNDKSLLSRCNSLPVRYSQLTNGALLSIYHSPPEAKHNPCATHLSRSQMRNVFEYLNTECELNCIHEFQVGFDPDLLDDVADDTTAWLLFYYE